MTLIEPHSLAEALQDFSTRHSPEIVYPIFGLLRRVVLLFPVLESREAVGAFVWVVGKIQTEAVTAEKQKLAKRTKNLERLESPLRRGYRQVIDYYFADIQEHPADPVTERIPRWGREVKTLRVYKGKIVVPHPTLLAWDYDLLLRLCDMINKEIGFTHWKKLAAELPQKDSTRPAIPVSWWSKGAYFEICVPDNATPSEAAYLILSAKTGLSVERLRKLIQEGRRLFPDAVLQKLQRRWEKAFIDPKLGIVRIPLEDEKNELVFNLKEAIDYGFIIE